MAESRPRICVIGRGVIGLSTAIVLAERGYRVTVRARGESPEGRPITSEVAAAFWYPYRVDSGRFSERDLAGPTLDRLLHLEDPDGAGVHFVDGEEYFDDETPPGIIRLPWWRERPELGVGWLDQAALPAPSAALGTFVAGLRFRLPTLHMPTYLDHLAATFARLGGESVVGDATRIDDAAQGFDGVVNCTGPGARRLVPDPKLYPLQGQVLRVRDVPFGKLIFIDQGRYAAEPLYIVPRPGRDVVLGGTAVPIDRQDPSGAADLDDPRWTEPSADVTRRILARCSALHPPFVASRDFTPLVGLRPCREPLRLEVEQGAVVPVVHNYGHGGGGVTLSWGSALEVGRLVDGLFGR